MPLKLLQNISWNLYCSLKHYVKWPIIWSINVSKWVLFFLFCTAYSLYNWSLFMAMYKMMKRREEKPYWQVRENVSQNKRWRGVGKVWIYPSNSFKTLHLKSHMQSCTCMLSLLDLIWQERCLSWEWLVGQIAALLQQFSWAETESDHSCESIPSSPASLHHIVWFDAKVTFQISLSLSLPASYCTLLSKLISACN